MLSRHTKRALLGLVFAGIVLVVVGAASKHYFAGRALGIRLEQELGDLIPPEPMLLAVARSDRASERFYAVRLQPFQRTAVAAEISGRVKELLVETGDSVEGGAVLLRLDDTLARLNLAAAEAAMQAAQAQLRELRRRVAEAERLSAAQTIPETQVEEARSQAEVQEAEVNRLRAEVGRQQEMLARHEVRAPFAGNVNQRLVEIGDSVSVNQPLVSLVSLDPLRVRFFVSDLEVGSFRVGDRLALTLSTHPGRELEAPVISVARSTDPVSGLYLIEARVPNPDRLLSGGAQGRIEATIQEYRDELFVPASAIRFEGRTILVEVWNDGEIELRDLEVGPEIDGHYPVFAGLEEGEILVVR